MEFDNNQRMVSLAAVADWQVAASEQSFLQVRYQLRKFAKDMQQALSQENKGYRSRIEEENRRFENYLASLRKQYLDTPNQAAERVFQDTIAEYRITRDHVLGTIHQKLSTRTIRYKQSGIINKVVTFFIAKSDSDQLAQFNNRRNTLENARRNVDDALDQIVFKARAVRDASIQLNNRLFEQEKATATSDHRLKLENIENEHRNTISMLINTFSAEFARYFNTAAFTTAYEMAYTRMRSPVGYTCSDKIPDALYLGLRTFTISNGSESFDPEVINAFRKIEHRAVNINAREIQITLPFFRSIEEGYSIYLEVQDAAAGTSNKILWDYIMKVLMNFPAGQTRPLLLDADSTTELTDFKAIGDSSGKNMITKPWTTAADIEVELKKLATEHSNLTISYGKDIASRMAREPIYVVGCRNFPKGISQDAMNSMSTILSAGASRGFFGMLQASIRELNARKADATFAPLLDNIKKYSLCVTETANGYVIQDPTGSDRLEFERMTAAESNKREILSHLIDGVTRYRRQIEKFEYLFSKDAGNLEGMDMHNINSWYLGDSSSRFEVPIGISGANTVQKYAIGGVAQHGLISGVTGSGKSTLLKTIIVAAMMKYTPENLNLYLVDFKEGVEFATFSEYPLPWIKTIALNTQRVFALNILKQLEAEFKQRADTMRRESVNHISETRQRFPRILLIFDEVQELLRTDDEITRECVNILSGLVSEGRAMNINVIMASQNFAICRGVESLKANMVIRVALKGSPESARIVMGDDFSVDQLEQGDSGSAAINTASGARGQTSFFQVGYMEDEEMKDLLSKLAMTMRSRKADTRIMAIHANQDRNSKFNRFITDGEVDCCTKPGHYELMLGDEFIINRRREITIAPKEGDNFMLVGESEATAKSVFALSILSVLYGELASNAPLIENELVRIIDMSDEYAPDADYLDFLSGLFSRQINRVAGDEVKSMIDDTYQVLVDRKRGRADKSERLFLMIFGLDSIQALKQDMLSEDEGELSLNKKLLQLIQQGPENGINCILWARSYDGFRSVVDPLNMNRHFNKRIYFGGNEDVQSVLGIKYDMSDITEKTVAYRDMFKPMPNAFRVFELPHAQWVESIAEAYKSFRQNQ